MVFQFNGQAPPVRNATGTHAGLLAATDYTKLQTLTQAQLNTLPLLLDPPRFRAYSAAAQAIPSGVQTPVGFDNANYNTRGAAVGTGGCFAANVWTVPPNGGGLYLLGFDFYFDLAAGTGRKSGALYVNTSAGTLIAASEVYASTASQYYSLAATAEYRLVAGDTVGLYAFQNLGVANNSLVNGTAAPALWGRWVAP